MSISAPSLLSSSLAEPVIHSLEEADVLPLPGIVLVSEWHRLAAARHDPFDPAGAHLDRVGVSVLVNGQ